RPDAVTTASGASCCSEKPKPKRTVCGCPCCGDSCPMGDACTCGPDGKSNTLEGLFFKAPGCHPGQSGVDPQYLPLSMRLVFVSAPGSPALYDVALWIAHSDSCPGIAENASAPPVPPPRSAAA